MASHETLEKLAQNPDWLPPLSDLRVFLGQPGAPEATKTTVVPGNVFSPGMFLSALPGGCASRTATSAMLSSPACSTC